MSTRPCSECVHLDPSRVDGNEAWCRSGEGWIVPTSDDDCPDFKAKGDAAPPPPMVTIPAPLRAEIVDLLRFGYVDEEQPCEGGHAEGCPECRAVRVIRALEGR
jgi:hypothetical protein